MKMPVLRMAGHATLIASINLAFATTGAAHSTGINGRSGKNNGFYCRNCHAGGTLPTVEFEGPTAIEPGSTATFRFKVASHSTEQVAAGLDVAASDGSLGVVAGQGTILLLGEVTHSSPKANDEGAQATFEFTWQAPITTGTYTLFGAGASVDGNSEGSGDSSARATYEIVVGAVPPTATHTPQPPTPSPSRTPSSTPGDTTCVGDCNGQSDVTIEELITGVNMALGTTPLSACPVFDANGNGIVTIDELLRAVNNALNGCPAP